MTARIRTILVDDESLARRGLEIRLRDAPDFEVVAQCANGREAIAAITEHKPDVVFLDIQMPGLSGFDVVASLPHEGMPLVIFVTAYDQYAIRAFEARAVDYLLKPVDERRFAAALDRARDAIRQRHAEGQRDRLVELLAEMSGSGSLALDDVLARGRVALGPATREPAMREPAMLPIRQGRDVVRVPMASIEWIDAAGDYMCVHAGGSTHILRATMKELEDLLDGTIFTRVHRSTIVNLQRVRSLRAHMNGEYFLQLEGGHELKLSRSYREKVELFLRARPV